MAEELVTGSIAAPGFSGLNTQDSSIQLDSGFALEANNCVIDRYGRIGARKGWTKVNTSAASTGSFRAIYELIKDDGTVTIASTSAEGMAEAKARIEGITAEAEVGKIYEGPVVKLLEFGALVNILPGKDGLLHISEISNERVKEVKDYLAEGQVVRVKLLAADERGRLRLSLKAAMADEGGTIAPLAGAAEVAAEAAPATGESA